MNLDSNLFLLRGLPGAGKTLVAQMLCNLTMPSDFVSASADENMVDIDGNYNFDPSKIPTCHGQCQLDVKHAMQRSVPIIVVHNTFTQDWELAPYYNLASNYAYNVHSLIVENRHGSSDVHDVPGKTIDKMNDRFNVELLPIESDWWQKYIS